MNIFLQIFLGVDIFLMGGLTVIALQHARAHFRPSAPKQHTTSHPPTLSAATRETLLQEAQVKFQTAVDNSATKLKDDLEHTALQLNKLLEQLGATVVGNELEHYRQDLADLRKQAEANALKTKSDLTEEHDKLRAQMAAEITAEKEQLIKQIDTKLSDAVGSFLLEALQHNVDLGAQSTYLMALLEEHKADFAKEVTDET